MSSSKASKTAPAKKAASKKRASSARKRFVGLSHKFALPPKGPLVVRKIVDGYVVYSNPIEPKHLTREQIAQAVASTD